MAKGPGPIAVFDIDGTLTDTVDVDLECYETAIWESLGIELPSSWPSMNEVTDPAILATACEMQGRKVPDPETQELIAARVGELLAVELRHRPQRFSPIPGARDVFRELRSAGWQIAMATGAWRPSALIKLKGAQIPTEGVPLATATEEPARRDIISHAVSGLSRAESGPAVYFGDGVWDGRAATSLGFTFIGIGPPSKEASLRAAGARGFLNDFSDSESVLAQLDLACRTP